MSTNRDRRIDVTGLAVDEQFCEHCDWDEHPIVLTLHHIFPRHLFNPQPRFDRIYRYLIICPTCHALVHVGIISEKMLELIKEKIDECEKIYKNYPNIDEIISTCRRYYNIQ